MAPKADIAYKGVLRTAPNDEERIFMSVDDWLEHKRNNEGAEGLWRVHNKLYDLTSWIKVHPGGSQWLEETKGTDITEAFECSHMSNAAESLLPKFYVREARVPRNSLITFHENGFYKTLKRKIVDKKLLSGKNELRRKTKVLADCLAVSVFATAFLGTAFGSLWLLVSGVLLASLAICAHNFFHLKNNWRMYYFQLSLMSVREWRISHALSHHIYTNTKLDMEVNMIEPFCCLLPKAEKKFRYISWIFTPFLMAFIFHFQFLVRWARSATSKFSGFRMEEVLEFSLPLFLYLFSGQDLWSVIISWNIIIISASFTFGLVGLTAAHHHPDIYHDGDFFGNDKDFGILQLAAVRNRIDVDSNFVLTVIMFGEHALHHLFPTIDHSQLPVLDSVFEETCREFKVNFKPLKAKSLIIGLYQQLSRNYLNSTLKILENN